MGNIFIWIISKNAWILSSKTTITTSTHNQENYDKLKSILEHKMRTDEKRTNKLTYIFQV